MLLLLPVDNEMQHASRNIGTEIMITKRCKPPEPQAAATTELCNMAAGERLQLVGGCPLLVKDVQVGRAPAQFVFTFQLEALTNEQRATILASGQEPSFVSDAMRKSIEHGGALSASQCSSALAVGVIFSVSDIPFRVLSDLISDTCTVCGCCFIPLCFDPVFFKQLVYIL
jgi:hypothetical protein